MSSKHWIGLGHRVAYAALVSLLVWVLALTPFSSPAAGLWVGFVARGLDLPIAVVTLLGVPYLEGLDLWFNQGVATGTPVGSDLVSHLRTGIVTYVILFYVLGILRPRRGMPGRRAS